MIIRLSGKTISGFALPLPNRSSKRILGLYNPFGPSSFQTLRSYRSPSRCHFVPLILTFSAGVNFAHFNPSIFLFTPFPFKMPKSDTPPYERSSIAFHQLQMSLSQFFQHPKILPLRGSGSKQFPRRFALRAGRGVRLGNAGRHGPKARTHSAIAGRRPTPAHQKIMRQIFDITPPLHVPRTPSKWPSDLRLFRVH